MSDNDGLMLMNFTTESGPDNASSHRRVKVTGGKWKERRKLKMKLEGRPLRPKRPAAAVEEAPAAAVPEGSAIEPAAKRPRGRNERAPKDVPPQPANAQVVSSLFTSTRAITTSVNDHERASNDVAPSNAPLLQDTFEALGVRGTLLEHLTGKMKIQKPTKIQKMAIPEVLNGKADLFLHAQTGSGKTLAFLLPVLQTLLSLEQRIDRHSGCFAMIVTPTRELAAQIYGVISTLAQCCHYLVPCLLVGGERKKSEKARLRKGANFIVGTPGRMLDHLQNTKVAREQLPHSLRYLILDEGDKLMELGFEETLKSILEIVHSVACDNTRFPRLPQRIVHVLCSATRQGTVSKLGDIALTDPKVIAASDSTTDVSTVPDQLLQKIAIVPPKLRLVTLCAAISELSRKAPTETTTRTIVFISCADSVDFHYDVFSGLGGSHRDLVPGTVRELAAGSRALPCFSADSPPNTVFYKLHGSLPQAVRVATLRHFSSDAAATRGKHLVLFCTDVASRGLDLPRVSTVIEMDPPFAVEDHLHRIGRTARAGVAGESLLFLLPGEEEGYMEHIRAHHPRGWELLRYDRDLLAPAFAAPVARSDRPTTATDAAWDSNATTWHLNVERRVLEDPSAKDLAIKGYTSHIRAYATHISQEKRFFNVRCLHLGHLAKAFGLRERPKGMAAHRGKPATPKPKQDDARTKMLRMARQAVAQSNSEFNY
ncbi:AFR082Cp [Eremothecium gossypii ATCC 10895]|uniref:ATP-dependent RNA helicase DBP7 n=1 Tax=Eremothecium gossypii (strain ATCC 10895 / CBS 109.51 / FGSC 9923 / NRRL Y-1056) TaxID=284811 RepID=DBP7_EREGS|nr:AFR082Cp [Eremothecium gossypii ATCC 10895]Q754J2.1 RecName: Full=ATP-dependent RNA helicase DBP7 [Eremothecium gossypii ATCC 10895]AAS53453.1 AFR082Cp [Eremothecium gossypii ATCC 10895]AEY97765.1 FAFR082Cp [Eremothecium gossypii FDAG1]